MYIHSTPDPIPAWLDGRMFVADQTTVASHLSRPARLDSTLGIYIRSGGETTQVLTGCGFAGASVSEEDAAALAISPSPHPILPFLPPLSYRRRERARGGASGRTYYCDCYYDYCLLFFESRPSDTNYGIPHFFLNFFFFPSSSSPHNTTLSK